MVMYRCEPPHSQAHVIASARLGRSLTSACVRATSSTKPATTALAMRPPRSPHEGQGDVRRDQNGGVYYAAEAGVRRPLTKKILKRQQKGALRDSNPRLTH